MLPVVLAGLVATMPLLAPEATMLPEAATYQAVVADVDGDGIGDVVRLVAGEGGTIDLEVWRDSDGGWAQLGDRVNAVPGGSAASVGSLLYTGAPARLIVRHVDGALRATLVRQPRYEAPGLHEPCCLIIDDVVAVDGQPTLLRAAPREYMADAVLAIDMDGDGTDELLATRSLPILGDTAFPSEARVSRWSGGEFAPSVVTRLEVGSGSSPFLLGDSDGVPGDEAAFIGPLGRLDRLSLRAGDAIVAERGPAAVIAARAVELDGRRGMAVMGRLSGLMVVTWPRDEGLSAPLAHLSFGATEAALVTDGPTLAFLADGSAVSRFTLPSLEPLGYVPRTDASTRLLGGPLAPYQGVIAGMDALVDQGHLFAPFGADSTPIPPLAGTVPIGTAGIDGRWLVLWHLPLAIDAPDAAGGRLDAPVAQPGSGVGLLPARALVAQDDDGTLIPVVHGAIEEHGRLLVGRAGFVAEIDAPPGSRVYVGAPGSPGIVGFEVAPSSGRIAVRIPSPATRDPDRPYRQTLTVVTPGGRGHLAAWEVTVLDHPPLSARTDTPLGSSLVVVSGQTSAGSSVTVGGGPAVVDAAGRFSAEVALPPWPTDVEVVAVDLLGNSARLTVSGVGWVDYRGLPWIPMAFLLVVVAGLALYLRVPRARRTVAPAESDGALEELPSEADDR